MCTMKVCGFSEENRYAFFFYIFSPEISGGIWSWHVLLLRLLKQSSQQSRQRHGEVVPFFPFLTAVKTGETAEMLAEIGSTGVLMSAIVTAVWLGMVAVSTVIEKKALSVPETAKEGV